MAWNGSTNVGGTTPAPKKPAKKSPGLTHGLIAGAAIVLIGVISLYFVTNEPDEQPVDKKDPTQIAEVEPEIVLKSAEVKDGTSTEDPVDKFPYKEWLGKKVVAYECITNMAVGVITERLKTEDGKTHSIASNLKKNNFSAADNRILLAIGTDPSRIAPPAPMGHMSDAAARKDLEKEIVILPTDSPHEREKKEMLIGIRNEILARMDAGESFDDIIQTHREHLKNSAEVKRDAQKEINELDAAGHREEAYELAEAVNKKLDEYGVSHVQVPLSDAEKETIRQELINKIRNSESKVNQ